jgi:phosphotriesterase-related protein
MRKFLILFFLIPNFAFTLTAGTIMTVQGPIDSSELGRTLEHEHILVDFIGAEETGYHRWDRKEVRVALREAPSNFINSS